MVILPGDMLSAKHKEAKLLLFNSSSSKLLMTDAVGIAEPRGIFIVIASKIRQVDEPYYRLLLLWSFNNTTKIGWQISENFVKVRL